ncbi:MAG: gliding motility-associated C-terminal domain-containing protein [Burkholderiaceae bacterium]|nr:gliding motility-associated C-terminal domain-containing protein [Burkholderiaceae bacterium]
MLVLDAGNAGATYQWTFNGTDITGETNQTYTPTQSGNYSVTVNTGAQCQGIGTINVTVIQQLSVTVVDISICSDQPYPVLDAGVTGVNYEWNLNGNVVGTGQTYQPSAPGSYTVTVSIGNCSANDIFTVATVPVPVVTLSNATVCGGGNFPVLDAQNPGATYLWNTNEITQVINPNIAGTYTVTVTNGSLGLTCSATATATFTNAAPVVVTLGSDLANCEGATAQTIDAGNTGSTYVWSLNGTQVPGQTGQTINVTLPGTYSVMVTDANGCTGVDDVILTVNANPIINIGADLSICPGEDLPVLVATNPNASTYTWTSGGNVVGNGPTYDPAAYGTYEVTIVDNNGCVGLDQLVINEAPCEIEIPNVITPDNGDGLNDVFFIKNLDTNPNSQVMIFNRWGNVVYESSNYQNNWGGDDLPDGTYFYTIVLQTGKDYKGTLEIIRQK